MPVTKSCSNFLKKLLRLVFASVLACAVFNVHSEPFPNLWCLGKVAPTSQISAMHPDDTHSFIVVSTSGGKSISLYRERVSKENLLDMYFDPKISEGEISALNPFTSLLINRITGKFQVTQTMREIERTAIFAGECSRITAQPSRKF